MLGVLQALVGNLEDADPDHKGIKSKAFSSSCERVNTASTSATDHEGVLGLDSIPFSLEYTPFLVEVLPETDAIPLGLTVSPDDDASYLTIDDVRTPGLIALWNENHLMCADMVVRTGYTIISVNGVLNSANDMLATIQNLKKGSPLRLLIQGSSSREEVEECSSLRSQTVSSIDDPPPRQRTAGTVSSIDGPPPPRLLLESPPQTQRDPFVVKVQLGREGTPLGLAVNIDDDPSYVSIDGICSPGLIAEWNSSQDDALKVCIGDVITAVGDSSGSGRQLLDMMTSIQHFNRGAMLHLKIEPRRLKRRVKRLSRNG